ncbi:SLC17A6 [Bugula neritina]|uniref:SLC17A6 n=1 Tax=Bugula neritina TaxID=10212 RepID=A0A7J7KSB9_BUGNE|nr:SLC17A6 [Bugula neritina]
MVFSSDTPDNHPYISEQEMMCLKNETVQLSADWKSTPWASMLRSKPFIALCLCSFAKGWVFDLLLAEAPTFLNAFNLTVEEIGLFSALPFALRLALSYLSAIIGDYFINRNILSQTTARKLLNTIGFGTEAACLFSMGFIYSGSACVILLTIGSGTAGLYVSGWQTNHLDLAPQYVGILVAVTQSMSNLAGIIGPLLATYFISIRGKLTFGREIPPNISEDIYAWHMTFLISALIDATGCAFYATFASGELQPWATEEENTEELSPVASTSGAKSSYNAINQNKIR